MFTKRDTSIIKGFAILSIVFHNYFHWLDPSPGENEFNFSRFNVTKLFDLLGQQPGEFVNILFSYFGHYGVQLFIMVSGFGLALSMMNRPKTWESFVLTRLKKLYPLLLTGVMFYILGTILMEGRWITALEAKELGYKLLFIHTLIPESGVSVCGPWWFFGLIFQLYLLFPLLFHCTKKWGWKAFMAVCLISYGSIFLFREGLDLYHGTVIMKNAPGHLPEFCFGMMLAFNKDKRIHWIWLLVALGLFVGGNFTQLLYPFTYLALCVITVFAYQSLKSARFPKRWLGRPLAYFGGISMTLFVVNGFLRAPVLKLANTMPSAWGHVGSAVLFFLLAWGFALAAKPFYEFIVSLLDRIHIKETLATRVIGWVCKAGLIVFFVFVTTYFIVQNIAVLSEHSIEPKTFVTQGVVNRENDYITLAATELAENHYAIHINGSFDYKSSDAREQLPLLVMGINDVYWNGLQLNQHDDGEWTHYDFSCDYYRPFVKNIKGKKLSVYFWNRRQGEVQFRDVMVNFNY